ncbi:hypothetical protein SAMN06265827_12821 [Orenia metallireducens]|uniref:Uncharacterized protein n=1 Tax=Orenia metallireducens TaxID=1413210 RepID=A0A285HZT9_9FIRM|nr:hypothetical protein SAMN06265827_12821 [Orenia metallireducens]
MITDVQIKENISTIEKSLSNKIEDKIREKMIF